jgi:hypothetical protein
MTDPPNTQDGSSGDGGIIDPHRLEAITLLKNGSAADEDSFGDSTSTLEEAIRSRGRCMWSWIVGDGRPSISFRSKEMVHNIIRDNSE